MPPSLQAIDAVIAELEDKRQALLAQASECERAIEGMKVARRLLHPPAPATPAPRRLVNLFPPPSRPAAPAVTLPPSDDHSATFAMPSIASGRRGERLIPTALRDSVHVFLARTSRVFPISELRDFLASLDAFNTEDLGDVLTSHLRQLVEDGGLKLARRGVGRRVAEYARPDVAIPANYGENGGRDSHES